MFPSNLTEIILYLIPGFIALQVYQTQYKVKTKSTFELTVQSVIFGITISIIVKLFDQYLFCKVLDSTNNDVLNNFKFILALFIGGILTGLLFIIIHKRRIEWAWLNKIWASDPLSVWAYINQSDNQDWAVVYTDDNAIYQGFIEKFTYDPNTENQDFLLGKAKRVDDNLKSIYEISGKGVYINTRDVKRIEFLSGSERND